MYKADEKKESALISQCCEQVTISAPPAEKTPSGGNVRDTNNLSLSQSLFRAVMKQHAGNSIVRATPAPSQVSHEICFYSTMSSFKEMSAISFL